MKLFRKKSVWCLLAVFFSLYFIIAMIGGVIADNNAASINAYLKINPYEIVKNGDGATIVNAESEFIDYVGGYDDDSLREYEMEVSTKAAAEGSVILWNKNNALPVSATKKINLFGISSVNYMYSGSGSGFVGVSGATNLKAAFEDMDYEVNGTLWRFYKDITGYGRSYRAYPFIEGTHDLKFNYYSVNEVPFSAFGEKEKASVDGGTGIMIISRNAGEAGDLTYVRDAKGTYTETCNFIDENYLDLTTEEADMLENLVAFKKAGKLDSIIVLLNMGNPFALKHLSTYDIDACVYSGIGGRASCEAIVAALSGEIAPSGKLTDTFVYDSWSAPSSVNFGNNTFTAVGNGVPANSAYTHNDESVTYQEGIYVGYRYYETRYEDLVIGGRNADGTAGVYAGNGKWSYGDEVAYPFGYGENYTDFTYDNFSVRHRGESYEVSCKITNSGTQYSGREVLQVYIQKPYTEYDRSHGVEKSAVELVGFAKTPYLAPGENTTLTVTVDEKQFKTYDSYGARTYILEKGDYYLAAGTSAHNALNNILAAKGYKTSDGMDEEGNSSLAHKITVDNDDFEKYAKSSVTGNEITNQFDNADINLYEGTADQKITYLSRSDWQNTYPKLVKLSCTNVIMVADMQYGNVSYTDDSVEAPQYGQENGYTLAMFLNVDYDSEEWDKLLDQMTLQQQSLMLTSGYLTVSGLTGIAPGGVSRDGPQGIMNTETTLDNYMAFPNEILLAQTFDTELVYEVGLAFGMDCLHGGVTGLYGPGVNTHRSPLGGRNWEYYSEDGFLSGKMFAAETRGLTEMGVIIFAKHFALNEQESSRCGITTWANEQSIREIYLKAFELGVTEGGANGLMSSLNRVGCVWAGAHKGLMTNVLRGEWNFLGVMETDAGSGPHMQAAEAIVAGIVAGNDYWMPISTEHAFDAYTGNHVVLQSVREACKRLLYVQLHSNAMNGVSATDMIVKITPWWQALIIGVQIALGVLAGLCWLVFVLSIVFKKHINNKTTIEVVPLSADSEVKNNNQ